MSNSEKDIMNSLSLISRQFSIDHSVFKDSLDLVSSTLNAVVHLNRPDDLGITYVNRKYLENHEINLEYLQEYGAEFLNQIISPQTVKRVFPLIFNYLSDGDFTRNLNVIQEYKIRSGSAYSNHFSSINFNGEINQFVCVDFSLDELESGCKKFKKIIDVSREKENKYPLYKSLTKREIEVLKLVANGYSNRLIGEFLYISSHTVRTHRNNIYRKLGLKNIRDAIYFAELFDLIES